MLRFSGIPQVINFPMPEAGTEYDLPIPQEVKKFSLQARQTNAEIHISLATGETSTNFFTLRPGDSYSEESIRGPFTLSMTSDVPETVIELMVWKHFD